MLLADYVCTSSIQSFNFFAIYSLQWAKHSDVTGLELMGSIRGNTVKDNVVLKAILYNLERLVSAEAVINEYPWFLISLDFGLGVKHTLNPLQADLEVSISRLGAHIMLSRSGKCGLLTSMGCGWPNNHGKKRPTIGRNAFDRSHHFPFNTRASVRPRVVLTYQDLHRAKHAQYDTSFIHIVDISGTIIGSYSSFPITSNQCIIFS